MSFGILLIISLVVALSISIDLNKFKDQLKDQENSVKSGYRNGKWYPHPSIEGGSPTIAYGHKIKKFENFSNGISQKEAENLFESDFLNACKIAENDYVNAGYDWSKADTMAKFVAIDLAYNVGNLKSFPVYMKAMNENDFKTMVKECKCKNLESRNKWRENILTRKKEKSEF